MFATQIDFKSASAQVRAGHGIDNRAILRDDANVFGTIDKNLVSGKQSVAFIETRTEVIEEFFQLRDEVLGQIADLPAYACVGSGKTRAGEQLEKVIKFFALGERVEEDRHRAEIERHRAKTHQVRRNTRRFTANGANRFSTRRDFPGHQFFHRQRVSHVVRKWCEIIEPVGVRHELVVLHVLGDLLVAAMEKTDVRSGLGNDLAIELEYESQNTVRRRMRWSHVQHHLLADVGVSRLPHCRVGCGHSRDWVGRFNFARRKWHESSYKVKSVGVSKRNIYAGE